MAVLLNLFKEICTICTQAYTPALLMPASCFLAGWGAVYGPHWVDQVLAFITSFDVRVTVTISMCISAALRSHHALAC